MTTRRDGRTNGFDELADSGAEGCFLSTEVERDRFGVATSKATRSSEAVIQLVDFPLEPSDDDPLDALFLFRLQLARLGEADRIKLLQEPRKAASVTVMGRRREEELVLEVGTQLP